MSLQKISAWINALQYRLGASLFPVLEPCFRWADNWNPDIRRRFVQAVASLSSERSPAVALLHLNSVLSQNPSHFLARVMRGRIFLQEGFLRRASEDYLQANRISRYRFIHYDLYAEYLRSTHQDVEAEGIAITRNFSRAHELLLRAQEHPALEQSIAADDGGKLGEANLPGMASGDAADPGLSAGELRRFADMGPITQREVDETDWERLIRQLTS